jgi:dATP/dGTP diphosphohydrolase
MKSTEATSEFRIIDPLTGGEKGRKLARTDLLPPDALLSIAEHYGRGALKYEDRNWERGYAWSLSYGALLRHLFAWWGGEDIDAETGSSHLAAVGWHALALIAFETREVGTDDRPV